MVRRYECNRLSPLTLEMILFLKVNQSTVTLLPSTGASR
ncbi:hypothetical protein PC116_g25648 [Phytophthora cactorum]|nr:hypothetical protein PC117_g23379 [Phytophthora cactorum]KAG2993380.1 hypothetical protein PC120_g22261 [Phytophthora cactorum]KAG3127601.1 hypothetical protein C6341_g24907 [Phytophthora cactorum]KAG4041583.1 hypothetical protein PC123_g22909 [Phytophthora cactorum]KAG4225930.1 hypothetical protein PC116_g25648 [Phytophthora cactorum]